MLELLERDGALAALAEARDAAARGAGRVVVVSGEPGIGKTSLVNRSCAIATRDLAGAVSASLADALASRAAPHDVQALLLAELELPPAPTTPGLEDVHRADGATLDAVTVLGRRSGPRCSC